MWEVKINIITYLCKTLKASIYLSQDYMVPMSRDAMKVLNKTSIIIKLEMINTRTKV